MCVFSLLIRVCSIISDEQPFVSIFRANLYLFLLSRAFLVGHEDVSLTRSSVRIPSSILRLKSLDCPQRTFPIRERIFIRVIY